MDSSKTASKLFTVLTKVDKINTRRINEIVESLRISNNDVIAISSNTGYGIHKLKTLLMMKKQFIETKYKEKMNIKM